jgi:4-hydroxybenzoyl-CoA reductase subunit beta
MLRLPTFTYHRPKTAHDAVAIAKAHGKAAMFVAGGTDLYPNMKRRHQTPTEVISLQDVPGLHGLEELPDGRVAIGAMAKLSWLEHHPMLRQLYPAFAHAVREISTPLLRNMGTIGGNLLLDTRCTYYDQSHEWRESIDFCMKKDGAICWVAPGSPRCWAVQAPGPSRRVGCTVTTASNT